VARVIVGVLGLGLAAQTEQAPHPLHVDADHAGVVAGAAERRQREPREVAHASLVALGQRLRDLRAQLLEVDRRGGVLAPAGGAAGLADSDLERGRLGGAEEEALEDQIEDAAVLGGLCERRRECLLEGLALAPVDLAEHREGVEQLGCADRHALASQLIAQLEQLAIDAHASASPTRSATSSMSVRCLTITDIV
jgi:hypothetical protein